MEKKKQKYDDNILIRFVEDTQKGKYSFVVLEKKENKKNERIRAQRIVISNPEEEYVYSVS